MGPTAGPAPETIGFPVAAQAPELGPSGGFFADFGRFATDVPS